MDNKYKLLLVDDEPDNLALMYRTLRHDYDLVKTTSPVEALEILKTDHFDAILSDHKMPEMDGVEFLKRSCSISPDSMRLLITAFSDAGILIDAINYAKIYRYVKKPYTPEELVLTVANTMEYHQLKKDNEVLIKDMKELFSGTITAIIEALDAKDSFTLGRSRRVTFYTMKISEAMGINDELKGKIELASMLHDIGMIGISDDILSKMENLTPEEFEEIKKHVAHGVRILEDIKQLKEVVEIIKYHHEFYNGQGYPYGLKGEEIPIGAKIIAVADGLDSILHTMQTPDYNAAMERIKAGSGTQYDPEIVAKLEQQIPSIMSEIDNFEAQYINGENS